MAYRSHLLVRWAVTCSIYKNAEVGSDPEKGDCEVSRDRLPGDRGPRLCTKQAAEGAWRTEAGATKQASKFEHALTQLID